jgi:hypothetical protein
MKNAAPAASRSTRARLPSAVAMLTNAPSEKRQTRPRSRSLIHAWSHRRVCLCPGVLFQAGRDFLHRYARRKARPIVPVVEPAPRTRSAGFPESVYVAGARSRQRARGALWARACSVHDRVNPSFSARTTRTGAYRRVARRRSQESESIHAESPLPTPRPAK